MNNEAICKGSLMLLSGCQRCSRCRQERDDILTRLSHAEKHRKATLAFQKFMVQSNRIHDQLSDELKDIL